MTATRHAKPGSAPRQERFASAEEFNRVLKANLVAKRAELVENVEHRELIWFIQYRSVQDLGLETLTREFVEAYASELATEDMRKLGFGADRIYNLDEARRVRMAFVPPGNWLDDDFGQWTLRGDLESRDFLAVVCRSVEDESDLPVRKTVNRAPDSIPAKSFHTALIERAMGGLMKADAVECYLQNLCLDPKTKFQGLPYFANLIECLLEYRRNWCASRGAGMVETEINRKVCDELDYGPSCPGKAVVISGEARIGKTHGAKLFCDRSGGMARYVQTPATNDEGSFLRAIARALGVTSGVGVKIVDVRDRIEETLRRSGIMLVLDEGHYLFPQSNFRATLPARLNWIMTALLSYDVPVGVVTTPQFFNAQRRTEERTFWNSAQLRGRIAHYEELPNQIAPADMEAVARYFLPQGCADSIAYLVAAGESTQTYLAGMESIVSRARHEAKGEPTIADVMRVADRFIASNTSLTRASLSAPRRGRKRVSIESAAPLQAPCTPVESRAEASAQGRNRLDSSSRGNVFSLTLPSVRQAAIETTPAVEA